MMRIVAGRIVLTGLLAALCAGCALVPSRSERFAERIDTFAADLIEQDPAAIAAVVPASLLRGVTCTRLEEYAVERLALALRRERELYTLSRENWFELRAGQPLTVAGPAGREAPGRLVVFQVAAHADDVLRQIVLQGTAVNAQGQPIPGVIAEVRFPEDGPEAPAYLQQQARPVGDPLPEGLEERPFVSIDHWAYSLATELAEAYRANVAAAPAAPEVNVVLQMRALSGTLGEPLLRQLESALQQAIVAKKGFACAVGRRDFAPLFAQAEFYRQNRQAFTPDDTLFTPGSVLLLAEVFPHRDGGKIGVNLRALWRALPAAAGPAASGGTYLAGFTARAYLATGSAGTIVSPQDRRRYEPAPGRGFE